MATKQRLRELAYADINRECAMFERLSGDVVKRTASPEELNKYRKMSEMAKIRDKWRKEGEKYYGGNIDKVKYH